MPRCGQMPFRNPQGPAASDQANGENEGPGRIEAASRGRAVYRSGVVEIRGDQEPKEHGLRPDEDRDRQFCGVEAPHVRPPCGCARSQSGRGPRTGGTISKLCSGGGEEVAHSSVQAFHGLSPASAPERRLISIFASNTRTEIPMTNAPIVEIMFNTPHPGRFG